MDHAPAMTVGRQPLRVQFFTQFCHSQGTYFRTHNLAIGLTALGHEVTIYSGDLDAKTSTRTEHRDGVRYEIIPECRLNRLFGMASEPVIITRRFLRSYPACDVAHLFQPFPSAAAGWARSRSRAKFYDWDDLWSGGLFRRPVARWRDHWVVKVVAVLEPRLPSWANHVTAASNFLADRAREAGAGGVSVIHNGVWTGAYPDQQRARCLLSLRTDALYAGFMGRTADELPWCFDAVAENLSRHPDLRLAVCGAPEALLGGLEPGVRQRVDYLGQLRPDQTRAFAAALDVGLLPLSGNAFNRSRFPIKFSEHLATGVPLLCSAVGDCGKLIDQFRWAVSAGTSRAEWLAAFRATLDRIAVERQCLRARPGELSRFAEQMSWQRMSAELADVYYSTLHHRIGTGRGVSSAGRTPAVRA
jgi:glycosyltransferase involved in cell wall biosynthesis